MIVVLDIFAVTDTMNGQSIASIVGRLGAVGVLGFLMYSMINLAASGAQNITSHLSDMEVRIEHLDQRLDALEETMSRSYRVLELICTNTSPTPDAAAACHQISR